ncbi:hypothetical protein GCM10010425_29840 [Streptomyces spororaveus]|uniref:Uncharacterized protein n=1 Tax=Streptomyces spororaveus TaxID=284039 RepID=A0ABQ3T5X7_9ACTN|nr:hypothetical protein Sspor_13680 [Streptomyces spororaveus]
MGGIPAELSRGEAYLEDLGGCADGAGHEVAPLLKRDVPETVHQGGRLAAAVGPVRQGLTRTPTVVLEAGLDAGVDALRKLDQSPLSWRTPTR